MVEYSSRQARGTLRLLAEVARRDQHIHEVGKQHDLKVLYALTLGYTDLVSLRFSRSLYPFAALPSATAASTRRCMGAYVPKATELAKWQLQASVDAPESTGWLERAETDDGSLHIAPGDPLRPFLAVLHFELNPIVFQLDRGGGNLGPARRSLGAIASRLDDRVFGGTDPDSPEAPGARVLPLLGLDRVPLSLVVRAATLDDIGQVVWDCRELRLGQIWAEDEAYRMLEALNDLKLAPPAFLGRGSQPWSLEELKAQPLFADSVTVMGAELQFVHRTAGGLLLPEDLSAVGGRGCWQEAAPAAQPRPRPLFRDGRWRIGCDGRQRDAIALKRGGFIGYVRRPAQLDPRKLEGLAALVGMQAVNDQRKNAESKAGPHPADLWYFGHLDGVAFLQGDLDRQPEGIGDPNRPQTYSRGRVYQLLHDVTLGADVPPKPDGDSNALRHNNEQIARQVGSIHTHTVAFIEPSDGVTAAKEAELALSWALDDALARVGRRHGSHDDAGDGEGQPAAGWMRRWVAACTRASFSYSFTTAGCNLIASTVQLIETDLPTFFEMEQALEVLVGAAEQAMRETMDDTDYDLRLVRAERGDRRVPHHLFNLFQGLERLYDSRLRRSPPVRRNFHPGSAFDILPGYRASRQAFSALCQSEAALSGMTWPILYLDSSFSETSIQTELYDPGGKSCVSLMEVPTSTFLMPMSWRIAHEFGHEALKLPLLDADGRTVAAPSDPPIASEARRAYPDKLANALRVFTATAKRMATGSADFSPPSLLPRPTLAHGRSIDGALRRWKRWLDDRCGPHSFPFEENDLLKLFTATLRELPADLMWARSMHKRSEPVGRSPAAMRRFWWHYGMNLVHAHHEKLGAGPMHDTEAQGMLLRIILLSVVVARVEAKPENPESGIFDWKEDIRQVVARVQALTAQGRPDHVPQRLRDPDADADAALAKAALEASPTDRAQATAIRVLSFWLDLDWHPDGKAEGDVQRCYHRLDALLVRTACQLDLTPLTGDPDRPSHQGQQVDPMLQAWLRLCLLIYQGPGPAVATQPTAEDAAAWKTRDRYLDYVDAVIGAADAEISADAGDERKVPWLACDRGWRGNPANRHLRPDWRRPGPRSPWTSHRGGIRAGETDCDAAGFCEKYHQQTIDLLIDLAHRNRAGRFARLQALIKPPDPAHATADPTTDPVEGG